MVRLTRVIVGCAAAIVLVVALALIFRPHAAKTPAAAGNSPIPVLAAPATAEDVPIILRGLGNVTAFNTVAVRTRVTGNIIRINFTEGQEVKAGDLLIEIDARPFQAVLDQANATLAKDEASLKNAQTDLARYAQLLQKNYAPEQQYATQQATVEQDEATIKNDQAAIDAAKLNVEYASIRSPIDGIVGIRQVDVGNLVQANSQTLLVITQIKPIFVIFSLPEADIPRIRSAMTDRKLAVQAYDPTDQKQISKGVLNLIDNQVDQATGTVKLKAEFTNSDAALWPGQFVNAHLVLEVVPDGVTVPAAAVQTGPNGHFVYVVRSDGTADLRTVTVIQTENERSLIGSGVTAGEQVVTAGWFRLTPGAKVTVSTDNTPAGAPATVGAAGTGTR
ncbi:MAG TPA: efflux RND transporter periplasmic adaptor subunit [Xanthobacteraceae bacterium]|jgi:multidrug efflux system membrane fusion protein